MKHLICFIIFLSISHTQFDWQEGGAPIRQGLHIEWQRTGDANSDGTMIYAWSDCRNGIRDIIAQKIDKDGNNMWGENGVVLVTANGRQEDPQLVIDGNGGAYVIWMDYRNESDSEGDVYAQHINSEGVIQWGTEGIALVNKAGKQASPNICSDGFGGAFVIWKDNSESSYGDIYGTHLSASGVLESGIGIPIITFQSYRSSPSLNTGGGGSAVMIWSDDRGDDLDLYAQRIILNGSTISTEWGVGGKLVCNANGNQSSPRVSQYEGEETIITWEDERDGVTDAYYQILDVNGNEKLQSNGAVVCSGNWEVIKPRVKAENSIAYIVWEDRRNDWTSDIYAQKINSSGDVEWGNGLAIAVASGSQTEPRLTSDGSGGVYFVWEDQRNSSSSGIDIYAQHINANDVMNHSENGLLICDADNLQFNPLVRNDGEQGAIIIWGDQRTGGSYSINVQHIAPSGLTLQENGKESFFGIATDAANEPYEHGILYLGDNSSLIYWQDNRGGDSKIYGSMMTSSFDVDSEIFSNGDINGIPLTDLELTQEKPYAILTGDKIFLSFKVEESPNENLYFQFLDTQDLSMVGNSSPISDPSTSKQGFDMTYGNDGFIYYVFSEEYDITVNKISTSGFQEWSVSAVQNSADDIIKSIYPLPGSGCIIIYESQSFFTGSQLYALRIDGDGNSQAESPIILSSLNGDQYFESSIMVNDGLFISFKDNSSGNYDLYGQYVSFDGNLNFGDMGLEISIESNDQEGSAIAYDDILHELLCCYESSIGSETNILCNEIELSSGAVSSEIIISSNAYNQENPSVIWSGESYLISWEDSRNTEASSDLDIYFQEFVDGSITFSDGGYPLCDYPMKQERPLISQYDSDSFVVIWEDYRSTGKEFCANLYGQSFSISSACASLGDMNGDDGWNVLDIVALANCVLASNCGDVDNGCAGDMNDDGGWNVLDIVALANCVLASNCSGL
ncbi:MAG: hypothetical protein VX820_03635 [Candidatus Neomarinimicrobiota bacterium]|nr:hypothetical protein [Candidatus Neomarinimicrobiota bacterium]